MARKATGHVRLRPNGSYEVMVSMGVDPRTGKRVTKSKSLPPGSTEDQAADVLKAMLGVARKQRSRHSRDTVSGLLDEYVAQFEGSWTPTGRRETQRIIDKRLVPALGTKRLDRLSTADIDRFYRELRTTGRRPGPDGEKPKPDDAGLAEATVQRIHRVLHAALELGVRWELLPTNPAGRATLHELDEVETHPPTVDEARVLLAAADALDDAFGAYIRIAAASGCRRGELCGLQRSAVEIVTETDDDGIEHRSAVLSIRRVVGYGPDGLEGWDRTKARRRRLTPIGAEATAILEAHMLRMDKRALGKGAGRLPGKAYVWSNELDGSRPWDPEYQTRRWIKLRRGLALDHVRLHDIRHFAGSTITSLTGNQKLAQGQLGHRHSATTDRYVHVVPAAQREAAEKLDQVLSGKGTGEARTKIVANVTGSTLREAMRSEVDAPNTVLHTDGHSGYRQMANEFAGHEYVDHSGREYVRGDVSTNMAESFFAQMKRSLDGTYHNVSKEHLHRYAAEFTFRWNTRKLTDHQRVQRLVDGTRGKRLTYRPFAGGAS